MKDLMFVSSIAASDDSTTKVGTPETYRSIDNMKLNVMVLVFGLMKMCLIWFGFVKGRDSK